MHLFSPDELKLKIREMWMYLFSWDWASFISLVMLVWCHIISYTSNIFLSSLLTGKMSENADMWFEDYILDITEEPMKGELYTLFNGIYFFCACFIHPVIDLSILYICTHLRIHRFPEDRRGVTFSCNWDFQHGVRWLYHHDTYPASMDM